MMCRKIRDQENRKFFTGFRDMAKFFTGNRDVIPPWLASFYSYLWAIYLDTNEQPAVLQMSEFDNFYDCVIVEFVVGIENLSLQSNGSIYVVFRKNCSDQPYLCKSG